MKKLISLFSLLIILCLNSNIFGSIANDFVYSDSVVAYLPITGDTIAQSTGTSTDPFQLNDVSYGPIAIPFVFIYDCNPYDSYYINTNGFITFGGTAPGISNYGPISSSETYLGAISAFGRDLIGVFGTTIDFSGVTNVLHDVKNFNGVVVGRMITAATGIPANTFITGMDTVLKTITISNNTTDIIENDLVVQIASGSIVVKTEGVEPFRIHTIQWTNFRQYIIEGTDDNFNFQIKLYEVDASIHIIYGNMTKNTIPVSTVTAQVGLRGSGATDFNNRTSASDWGSTTPGATNAATLPLSSTVFPVSGQRYIWRPFNCSILPVEMSVFTSFVNGRNVELNWTTNFEVNNSYFDIERSASDNNWAKVGTVEGNGTTHSLMNYSYTDRSLGSGSYSYRLKQVDFNGNFEYHNLNNEVIVGIPAQFKLSQNYPNPFNPSTKINYDLPFDAKVNLKVFDISGKEIATLVNDEVTAGYYTINFNASNLPSGIYFYRINAEGTGNSFVTTKKMTLIK